MHFCLATDVEADNIRNQKVRYNEFNLIAANLFLLTDW